MKPAKVNLAAVAREAGVAVSTASLVLNGKAAKVGLAADTVLNIQRAASRLGYVPNYNARALRLQRSGLIGVVLSGVGNQIPKLLLDGIRSSIEDSQSDLVPLLTSHEYDSERELKELRFLMRNQVEAVIATPVGPYATNYGHLQAAGVPVLFVMHGLQGAPQTVSSVYLDSSAIAAASIRHLVSTGARRIAYLAWDYGTLMSSEKLEGVRRELLEVGDGVSSVGMFIQKPRTSFKDCLEGLFSSARHAPDAILCNPWEVAIDCLDYLDKRKISVPDDCSLLSLNNHPCFSIDRIGISAVVEGTELVGRRAGEVALALIHSRGREPVHEVHQAFTIVARKTTRELVKA